MANLNFDKEITALLFIDPYNDFISEGGKVVFQRLCQHDLDLQLKKHGMHKLIVMGFIAHTCVGDNRSICR